MTLPTNGPKDSTDESLHRDLVSVTIGGKGANRTDDEVAQIFGRYLERAVPGIEILKLDPIRTLAALNSVSARVDFILGGRRYDAFAKAHIESHTGKAHVSSTAGVKEYENAALLEDCGWPVVAPIKDVPYNSDFPVLLYPRVSAPTLFQLLENSYAQGSNQISPVQFSTLHQFEQKAGKATLESLKVVSAAEANNAESAPVQNLFRVRLEQGSRIDQWYAPDTAFTFPGVTTPITWSKLLDCTWNVNGIECSSTLREIIEKGRRLLSFEGESRAAVCISHGDDHAGNIFIDEKDGGKVFDPAFAGWNPASLSHVKAFFHSGIVPLAGLYYDPKISHCSYSLKGENLTVEIDLLSSPILPAHEQIARSIVDNRIVPLLEKMKELGFDIALERDRIRAAMATCCILVINVSTLLQNNARRLAGESIFGGTGEGLFPLLFLSDELKGLPQLDYLRERIGSIIGST